MRQLFASITPPAVHKILIVDDDPAVRAGLALLVKACGWMPCTFDSGEALLKGLGDQDETITEAACLVLDLQMPGLTGPELQRELRSRALHIPTIVVTAYSEHPLAKSAEAAGAIAVLSKPVPAELLREALGQAMKG